MPTENRSSNTELISLAASAIEDLLANGTGAVAAAAWSDLPAQLRKINLAPAQQHQGEPVAWLHGSPKGKSLSFSEAAHENVDSTPLYTHADPGEVERLRERLKIVSEFRDKFEALAKSLDSENDTLRAQLAELLHRAADLVEGITTEDLVRWPVSMAARVVKLKAALERSASAEPSAPLPPVDGDLLPPIGSKVLFHLAREDEWVEHTVVGYYVWGNHGLDQNVHRVFVRARDADGYLNARLLSNVRAALERTP